MEDHAARVDDLPQPWRDRGTKARAYDLSSFDILNRGAGSLGGHLNAQGLDDARMAELFEKLGVRGLVDQPAYGGQG
jgi:hypothetical protein